MAKLLEEIHTGEILLEDFMKPMGISARQLAADIDVSPSRISELVNGLGRVVLGSRVSQLLPRRHAARATFPAP